MKPRVLSASLLGLVLVSLGLLSVGRPSRPTVAQAPRGRQGTEVVLFVEAGLSAQADRLMAAYAPPAGTTLKVTKGTAAEAAPALAAGQADLALTKVAPTGSDITVEPVFYEAQVLTAPWLDPVHDLSLSEAQRLTAAANSGAGTAPGARLLPQGPGAFTPDLQPVMVNGVLPSLANIRSGRYPLSEPVYLVTRTGGPRAAVTSLAGWLAGAQARDLFDGAPAQATLTVFGDIMLSRGVDTQVGKYGLDWPFQLVADRTRAGDVTFANLESPLGVTGTPLPRKLIWFRGRPESVATLPKAGVDIVTIANNHILDYDTPNFLETLDLLDKTGVRYVGGGRTLQEAREPVVAEVNGIRIAFLGYSQFADIFWDYSYPRRFTATAATAAKPALPGVAPIRLDLIRQDIAAARQKADVVAVAYHWGTEYVNVPAPEMVALAHASVDAGADLVLGFHPHAVQGFERYKGKFIAYSLGNFVMDQRRDVTRESMILEFLLQKDGVRGVNVVPVMIEGFRPHLATGAEAENLWAKLRRISRQIPSPAGMAGAGGPSPTGGLPAPAPKPPVPPPATTPVPTPVPVVTP
ncbi:MAG: CapA family protein [Symbiobacteriia bacterium]